MFKEPDITKPYYIWTGVDSTTQCNIVAIYAGTHVFGRIGEYEDEYTDEEL